MSKAHLILSNAHDYHAVAVKWALQKLGCEAILWDGIGESEGAHVTFVPNRIGSSINLGGRKFDSFASAWFRRQTPSRPIRDVHPDSKTFVENELLNCHESLCVAVESISDFLIGGRSSRCASSKVRQLEVALAVGLSVPATIVSNDYPDVVRFAKEHDQILVKHFLPHYWADTASAQVRGVAPKILNDVAGLNRRSIEICPAIYQELIDKSYEIRVTVIGDRIFAAKIESRRGEAFLDWRQEYGNSDMVMSAMSLDAKTIHGIRGLMHAFDLRYGCIDFAVDRQGQVVFLEINPGGQFLFVEDYVPELRLLHAFASMLAARSPRYSQRPTDEISDAAFMASEDYARWNEARASGDRTGRFFTIVK